MEPFDIQLYRFTVMILAGVICGLVFDLYRVFRWITRPKGPVVALEDLLFWLVITVWVMFALYWGNWFDLRLYVLIGMGLGVVAYLYMASPFILRVLMGVAYGLLKAIHFSSNLLRKARVLIGNVTSPLVHPVKNLFGLPKRAVMRLYRSLFPPGAPPTSL